MIPLKDDTPSATAPYVTYALIAVCAAIYCWQFLLDAGTGERVVDALGAIPAVLLTDARLPPDLSWVPRYVTPFTSMFLHASWMHLLGNLLFLWIYGDNVEDALGRARYALFYVACGIVAVFAQALGEPHSAYPIIGASGAISGVLGAYLLALSPRSRAHPRPAAVLSDHPAHAGDAPPAALVRGSAGERPGARGAMPGSHFARTSAASWRACCSCRCSSGATCGYSQGVSPGARAPARAPGCVTVNFETAPRRTTIGHAGHPGA